MSFQVAIAIGVYTLALVIAVTLAYRDDHTSTRALEQRAAEAELDALVLSLIIAETGGEQWERDELVFIPEDWTER